MHRHLRKTILPLCLFVFAALFAQPAVTSRIESVKSAGANQIEIHVVSEKAGDFESVPENTFRLKENGVLQDSLKVDMLEARPEPSRTVILADLSRSLTRRQFANFKQAALKFVSQLKDGDLVALITFHRKVYRELSFTADRELAKKRIEALRQTGSRTMLYDALVEAHKMLTRVTPVRGYKKAIVVYTDGKENASRVTADDLMELYTAEPVPVFVAGKNRSAALKRLIRLARISGGDAFRAEERQDLTKIFRYLGRLKTQEYRLTYKTAQKPGASLDIEIEAGQIPPLVRSYTIPSAMSPAENEKLFAAGLMATIRTHMPEILLSLIVLLLIAVIIMLFFRKQEINVKVENSLPQAYVSGGEISPLPGKKYETQKAKLPLDYHHGWLVEKEGPHTGRKYRLTWHSVTLGYADDNSIVIEDNTVSPRHAKIEREKQTFILFDLLSENGTYLNGKKLLRPKELEDFDEIGLGRTKLIFRKASAAAHGDNHDA